MTGILQEPPKRGKRDLLKDIEKKYQQIWADEKVFEVSAPASGEVETCCMHLARALHLLHVCIVMQARAMQRTNSSATFHIVSSAGNGRLDMSTCNSG